MKKTEMKSERRRGNGSKVVLKNDLTLSLSETLKKSKKRIPLNNAFDVDIESGELGELCDLNIATTPRLAPNLQALLGIYPLLFTSSYYYFRKRRCHCERR